MTLTEFLLARIAEDEAKALRITPGRIAANGHWRANSIEFGSAHDRETTAHIIRWDPARVLAECEAKRQIVQIADEVSRRTTSSAYWGSTLLHVLALPYADHPDCQGEWKP